MAPAENESDVPTQDAGIPSDETSDLESANENGQPEEKLSLEIGVETPSACERHVTVTIPRSDIDRYFSKQIDELMSGAEVPGFRPGRAPRKLVESRFKEQVSDQVKGSLLLDSMTQVNDDQDFSAISEPDFDFDSIDIPDEGDLTFEFDIEVRPEFDMPQWKGLSIEKLNHEYTDEEINDHIKTIISRGADLVPHDGAVEAGDHVVLKIVSKDGDSEVASSEELTACVRAKLSFPDAEIEGFDTLMIGAKAGDTKTAKVTVSPDADKEEMREKELDLTLEVLDVKRLDVPEINAELLSSLGGFDDEAALKEGVQGELDRQLVYKQRQRIREQITETLTESANWELPPDLLRRQSSRELERAMMELQSSGFGAEVLQAYENQLRQNSLSKTEQALKEHFILERIAEDEDVEDSPEDYDYEIAMIAYQQNESPRRVRAQMEKRGQMDALRNQIIERKVLELIEDEANVSDVDYKPEENTTEAVDFFVGGGDDEAEIPEAKPGGDAESFPKK